MWKTTFIKLSKEAKAESQAAPEQETDGTKHDIHRYYRANSDDTDKPQHEAEQYRSPKDCINAFHRFSFLEGRALTPRPDYPFQAARNTKPSSNQ